MSVVPLPDTSPSLSEFLLPRSVPAVQYAVPAIRVFPYAASDIPVVTPASALLLCDSPCGEAVLQESLPC